MNEEITEDSNGCLFEISEQDYILGESDIDKLITVSLDKKFSYNQAKTNRTRNACVLYAIAGMVGDHTGYEFSEEELLEIIDFAEKDFGRGENTGMWFYKGADCVRNWWNIKFPENKLKSYRVLIKSDDYKDILKKGYSLAVGYKTTKGYFADSQDNGIIDAETSREYGDINGGHLVRTIKEGIIRDNYVGHKPYNDYANSHIEKFAEEGCFYNYAYLLVTEASFCYFSDINEDSRYYEATKNLKELDVINGYSSGEFKPSEKISRGDLALILNRVITLLQK